MLSICRRLRPGVRDQASLPEMNADEIREEANRLLDTPVAGGASWVLRVLTQED